jgi:hypothetical protein
VHDLDDVGSNFSMVRGGGMSGWGLNHTSKHDVSTHIKACLRGRQALPQFFAVQVPGEVEKYKLILPVSRFCVNIKSG